MKTIFRFGIILVLTALATGCNLPQARNLVLPGGVGPQAWIDAPLDGMRLQLSVPYDIVFHITADSPVAQGELSINGQVLATWLMLYAILRFCIEFFRGDDIRNFLFKYPDSLHPVILSTSQTISLLIFVTGVAIWVIYGRKPRTEAPAAA